MSFKAESGSGRGIDSIGPFGWVRDLVQKAHQSGSYSYDEATLTRIAERWRRLEQKCQKAQRDAEPMVRVQPPGLDAEASGYVAKMANASGKAYLESLKQEEIY
ncbi:MAG: hypothetical protein ACRDQB_12485, partial [Thermocrispum sp.]